jgi:uncharacterized membrane protein
MTQIFKNYRHDRAVAIVSLLGLLFLRYFELHIPGVLWVCSYVLGVALMVYGFYGLYYSDDLSSEHSRLLEILKVTSIVSISVATILILGQFLLGDSVEKFIGPSLALLFLQVSLYISADVSKLERR